MLDTVEAGVGVVMFEDPVGTPDGEMDNIVVILKETPDVGVVELADPLGTPDGELELVGADLRTLVRTSGEVVAMDGVELDDPLRAFETELEMTAVALEGVETPGGVLEAGLVALTETTGAPEETTVPKVVGEAEEVLEIGGIDRGTALFEGEAIVAVALGANETLVLVGAEPLRDDTVVAFTGEGSAVTVVVILENAVPANVSSTYWIAVKVRVWCTQISI